MTAALLFAACATPTVDRGTLPAGWQPLPAGGAKAAFHHREGGTIAVNVTCTDADDVPLDVLTNHLLFGVEHKAERSRTSFILGDRAALRTRLDGTLEGVAVSLDVVVLKKNGCTYDLMMIGPLTTPPAREHEFDRFVAAFVPERVR